jgi:trimeric autotransporter adhesin
VKLQSPFAINHKLSFMRLPINKTCFFIATVILLVPHCFSQGGTNHSSSVSIYKTAGARSSLSFVTGATTNSSFVIYKGMLWSCGDNSFGQLGVNSAGNYLSICKQVGESNDWRMVSPGAFHTLALKEDGSLWSWGDNQYGQLGDSTVAGKVTPEQIGTGSNWEIIAAADYQSYGIKKDGTLWAWGVNNYGQLGIGKTNEYCTTPVQVGTDNDWKSIAAGSFHTIGLKKDGSGHGVVISTDSWVQVIHLPATDLFLWAVKKNGPLFQQALFIRWR